jgi:hypothetical protein
MHLAALAGARTLVAALLAGGAELRPDCAGLTPVHVAAAAGHLEVGWSAEVPPMDSALTILNRVF